MLNNDNELKYTTDFSSMIRIIFWNSLGLIFVGFIISIYGREYLGLSGIQIGLLVSSNVFASMLSSFITGIITDKSQSKKILVAIGSFGRGISYLIIYFEICFGHYIGLLVGMFILGFMTGFYWIPVDTLVAEKSNKRNRSEAFGRRGAVIGIGQLVGAVLGFSIVSIFDFTENAFIFLCIFPFFAVANFFAGIQFIRKVDEDLKISYKGSSPFVELPSHNQSSEIVSSKIVLMGIIFLFTVVFMISLNNSLACPFYVIYIIENLNVDIFFGTLAFLPAGLLSSILAPKLGQKVDKIRPEVGIAITSAIGALTTWFLINISELWVFSMVLLVDLTIGGAGGLIFQNLLSRINVKNRGKIMGFYGFFMNLAGVIGPILGGFCFDIEPTLPFIITIFVELSLIPLYWIVVRFLLPHVDESYEISDSIS
ncbi:MAG: MFS transporter [Promethearchaeota archaeon]